MLAGTIIKNRTARRWYTIDIERVTVLEIVLLCKVSSDSTRVVCFGQKVDGHAGSRAAATQNRRDIGDLRAEISLKANEEWSSLRGKGNGNRTGKELVAHEMSRLTPKRT